MLKQTSLNLTGNDKNTVNFSYLIEIYILEYIVSSFNIFHGLDTFTKSPLSSFCRLDHGWELPTNRHNPHLVRPWTPSIVFPVAKQYSVETP